jgi:hypothetical protein
MQTDSLRSLRRLRGPASWIVAGLLCLTGANGCAATVKQAAKDAAPAAVEGAVEEAKQPDTRNDIATVLADPEIRAATSSLSAAFVAGALDGLSDEQRSAEVRRLTDNVVRGVGLAAARSLRDDIGPLLSKSLADVVDRTLEQALNEHTEQRLEALTAAVARGMAKGLVDSGALSQIAREVTHQAAFGLDDAVRSAEQRQSGEPEPQVLAALGTLSDWTQTLPLLILGGLALTLLGCIAALVWLATRVRHYKGLVHDQAVRSSDYGERRRSTQDRAPHSEPHHASG